MFIQINTVLLGGENTPWWQSLSLAFEQRPSFQIVAIVEPALTLITAQKLQPDILIWRPDLDKPDLPLSDLKKLCPFIIPIAVVQAPNRLNLLQLLKEGLCACLPLRLRPRQMVDSIDLMMDAGLICLPRLTPEFFQHQLNTYIYEGFEMPDMLTSREREILSLLADNCSNQEIAQQLSLAESTVKSHLHNIFRKLGVHNRTEALALILHK